MALLKRVSGQKGHPTYKLVAARKYWQSQCWRKLAISPLSQYFCWRPSFYYSDFFYLSAWWGITHFSAKKTEVLDITLFVLIRQFSCQAEIEIRGFENWFITLTHIPKDKQEDKPLARPNTLRTNVFFLTVERDREERSLRRTEEYQQIKTNIKWIPHSEMIIVF